MAMQGSTLRRMAIAAMVATALLGATSCSDNGDAADPNSTVTTAKAGIEVTGTWIRAAVAGNNSAIYMSIKGGAKADQLLSVNAGDDLAKSVEIHETVTDDSKAGDATDQSGNGAGSTPDGTAEMHSAPDSSGAQGMSTVPGSKMKTMRPVESIDIPAGGTVDLKPGGYHVMMMDLRADLTSGETVPVTLTFRDAGQVTVTAEVKEG